MVCCYHKGEKRVHVAGQVEKSWEKINYIYIGVTYYIASQTFSFKLAFLHTNQMNNIGITDYLYLFFSFKRPKVISSLANSPYTVSLVFAFWFCCCLLST